MVLMAGRKRRFGCTFGDLFTGDLGPCLLTWPVNKKQEKNTNRGCMESLSTVHLVMPLALLIMKIVSYGVVVYLYTEQDTSCPK